MSQSLQELNTSKNPTFNGLLERISFFYPSYFFSSLSQTKRLVFKATLVQSGLSLSQNGKGSMWGDSGWNKLKFFKKIS